MRYGKDSTRERHNDRGGPSSDTLRGLAKRYGFNPKTIAKWKARTSVSDLRTGPKEPRSTVLSAEEEAVCRHPFSGDSADASYFNATRSDRSFEKVHVI